MTKGRFTSESSREMQLKSVQSRAENTQQRKRRRHRKGVPFECEYHGLIAPTEVYTYPDGRRFRCRICQREAMAKSRQRQGRFMLPNHRLGDVLRAELDRGTSVRDLAARIGLSERRVHHHLYGQGEVMFDTLDRVLCKLDLVELLHLPPEMGGFDDLYENDERPAERRAA